MPSQLKFASVQQDSPSKVPILLPGDISPYVMRSYELTCHGYFVTKDIDDDKKVRKVLTRLCDNHIQDWVGIHRDRLLELSFAKFMTEFKSVYLPKAWEEITWIELLQLSQGSNSFWNFSVKVQGHNSIPTGTTSHLSEIQVRHHIESSMNPKLALRCCLEKIETDGTLSAWLNEVTCINELINAECAERIDFDNASKNTRENSRCTNALPEPSHHIDTNSTDNFSHISLPKLTPVKHQLLYDTDGCLKCRCIFVPHRSTDCPNDFPNALNYKPLMQSFVDLIKRRVKKPIAAIASSSNAEDATVPVPTTIAAIMGMSSNPTGYMVPNRTSVIKGDSFSDDSVSHPDIEHNVLHAVPVSSVLMAHADEMAPLTVPHLYWHCCVSGIEHDFPVTFDALLDHGADTVFISEQFTSSLTLKHHKLFQTMSVEEGIQSKYPMVM
jgi:hypothetical protein